MTDNVKYIFPADDPNVMLENAKDEIECGLVLGYDHEGHLVAWGGGTSSGRRPVHKDWLWLLETFKNKMLNGDYAD